METGDVGLHLGALSARWWVFVVRGIAAVLFGILAWAVPGESLIVLVYLWGAYAFVDGAFALSLAVRRGRASQRWGWFAFEGLVGVGAGLVTFFWPAMTALALLLVIAMWAVLTGIAEIAAAIWLRRQIRGEWVLAFSGLLSIAFGVLMLARPEAGALAVVWLIGTYALVFGVLLIGIGIRLHHLRPGGGAPSMQTRTPRAA